MMRRRAGVPSIARASQVGEIGRSFGFRESTAMITYLSRIAAAAAIVGLSTVPAIAQKDPGVRGGLSNTGGGIEAQGKHIPRPPVISPNPTTGAKITANELASFTEGIL